jgi:hypothetical protein
VFSDLSCCCWYSFSTYSTAVHRLNVEAGWSQWLLSVVCLTSVWNSSCTSLLHLYDTLVHTFFGFGWEKSMFSVSVGRLPATC